MLIKTRTKKHELAMLIAYVIHYGLPLSETSELNNLIAIFKPNLK